MFRGRLTAGRLYAGNLFRRDAPVPQPQPETRPAFGGGRAIPRRDARPARRDDDELLILLL